MQDTKFILKNNIKHYREAKYLMQKEVAERVGVHKATVSLWEAGVRPVSDRHKVALCKVLGCSILDLFEWEEK